MPDTEHGVEFEAKHVHDVYEEIAEHFSETRYKPWPIVSAFLLRQPPSSIGLDIGCGNGKYLSVNPSVYIVGSDRSAALARIAASSSSRANTTSSSSSSPPNPSVPSSSYSATTPASTSSSSPCPSIIVADALSLPHPPGTFDFAISIAVVHHLSTVERRRQAIGAVLECLTLGKGEALIYVWALEQRGSRRGWGKGDEQDRLVGWVLQSGMRKEKRERKTEGEGGEEGQEGGKGKTYERYYHLYREGELEADVRAAGGEVVQGGYERDNWWVVARRMGEA